MERYDVIQTIINKTKAEYYLEIGAGGGINFNEIKCNKKFLVEPFPKLLSGLEDKVKITHKLTSDDFFKQNKETFDVIFLDGLHTADQISKDIINYLDVLNEGGYIICHDMNPTSELMQRNPPLNLNMPWTGDVWKSFVKLKSNRKDLSMFVVDACFGCGVISKGNQKLLKIKEELTYELLEKNRKELLDLLSVDEFLSRINKK